MNRPPFQGNGYSGPNFQQGAQNFRPPNQTFCRPRPPGQARPNMVWNIFPDHSGPPNNSGQDWMQNGQQSNFHNGPRKNFQNGPRPNFQNGPRPNFQYGPRMQGGPRMNCENSPGSWQNRNPGLQQNRNECSNWNGAGGWQNKGDGQYQPEHSNPNSRQQRWGNKNQFHNQRNNSNMNFCQQRSQNNKNKNKNKVNKRDLAENNQFYCDVCDRGFKTDEKYQEHINGHEKCSVEGCTYLAAPKLVQLHYRLHHSTGLAKKIWTLESKEDIEKWRNERKRNYPTAENIEKKNKIKAERKSRGEVLETKEFGKFRKRQPGRQKNNINNDRDDNNEADGNQKGKRNRRKRKNNRRGNRGDDHDTSPAKKIKTDEENSSNTPNDGNSIKENESNGQMKMKEKDLSVDPLSYVLKDESSDEEPTEMKNRTTPVESGEASSLDTGLIGGLSSIQMMYGSDSESENETKPEKKVATSSRTPGNMSPEKKDVTSKTLGNMSPEKKVTKVMPVKPKQKPKKKTDLFYRRRRMTLLEKLLAKEIRQERNQILQCVHYIVKNKFFGVGDNKVSQLSKINNIDPEKSASQSQSIDPDCSK